MSNITAKFRQLHGDPIPLQLPNAWDAGSARLFESLGATAIATTSAGVAWALGYKDGRYAPVDEIITVTARMSRLLSVPLSVDFENGYSDNPKIVADNVMRLADLGVAGINLEDGPDKPALLASKIEAIRNAITKAGLDLFVNARSDVFLASLVEDSKLLDESVSRASLYTSAGADGFFLPGMNKTDDIKVVVANISLPLNVLAWPGLVNATELGKLGVRRLSAGSGIAQVLWSNAKILAEDFLRTGHSEPLSASSMPYPQLQNLFPEK